MRLISLCTLPLVLLCTTLPSIAAPAKHKSTVAKPAHATIKRVSSRTSNRRKSSSRSKSSAVKVASRAPMDTARATQIQTALIKSGYLSGEASGQWDSTSMAAMQKLQSDNGWQTKNVPDSRALIKLGLGPNATPPN